ncbi:MAG: division/cell wall cluster transcriptional repressor MraZ [Clostridia bacterium]|nr:division/cell wall cluster transcriptional repressor MraZ [Clostridia bacterium]
MPGMLTGKFFHSMDAKGRVKLPSLWEPALENRFWLMTGIGKFLLVFSEPQFEDFAKQIMQLPMTDPNAHALRLSFGSGAYNCELDKQGRFLIPQQLREFAGLEKDIVIAGAFSCGEIWDAKTWHEYHRQFASGDSAEFKDLINAASQQYTI